MAQQNSNAVIAREMLWEYSNTEKEDAKDFFVKLEDGVSRAISNRLQIGERIWVGREMRLQVETYALQAKLVNLDPANATVFGQGTNVFTQYQEKKGEHQDTSAFIAEIIRYPNERLGRIYSSLVGLEAIQRDFFRKLTLSLQPVTVQHWAQQAYPDTPPRALLQILQDRYPLLILEGQVGAGKTALARSVGHVLAVQLQIELALVIVNAQVRGGGYVGDLTRNISRAFEEATKLQRHEQIPVMILIDEADALAQARGGRQTHHEDDAGVNALIQCIDQLRGKPMAVIFATNLAHSLDAAIVRRATATYHFDRPSPEQRAEVFQRVLNGLEFRENEIASLVEETNPQRLPDYDATPHRYTYSDLTQRILPTALEYAIWAKEPLTIEALRQACRVVLPTPEGRH